jgi:hypothetical protein
LRQIGFHCSLAEALEEEEASEEEASSRRIQKSSKSVYENSYAQTCPSTP